MLARSRPELGITGGGGGSWIQRLLWLGAGRERKEAQRAEKTVLCPTLCRSPTCLQWSALSLPGRFPTPSNICVSQGSSSDPYSPHSTYNSKRISTQDLSTTYNPVTLRFPSSLSCSTTYRSFPFRGPVNNSQGNMHKSSIVILPPNY